MEERLEKNYWDTVKHRGMLKRSASHPVVEFFSNQRIEYMRKYIDFNSIKNALDVGSGTGFSSFHFPSFIQLTGVDFSYRNLIINPMERKIQASVYHLPFASNSFDLVYGWDFLHHVENPEKSVAEMARVSKKYLVLFEPNRNNPILYAYGLWNKNERGTLGFHKKRLLKFLDDIKFRLISCENVGWLFAGTSPIFSLRISKYLPFTHRMGVSSVIICEKT